MLIIFYWLDGWFHQILIGFSMTWLMCIKRGQLSFFMYTCHSEYFYANTILCMAQSLSCQLVSTRGRFRISGKGVQMYKALKGVRIADFISFSLNIPWKQNNFIFMGFFLKSRALGNAELRVLVHTFFSLGRMIFARREFRVRMFF